MQITYRVIGTSDGIDTTEQDFIYDDHPYPHSSHLVDIMRQLDYLGIDLRSITVVPYYVDSDANEWYVYESATAKRASKNGELIPAYATRSDAKAVADSLIEWSIRNA